MFPLIFVLQNLSEVEGKAEEEFTVARIYISKMKSEVKNLHQRCTSLETSQGLTQTQIEEREKELAESKLLASQHEAKLKSLAQSLKDAETKKRNLEEQVIFFFLFGLFS